MEIREAKDLLNLKWRHLTDEELEDLPHCTSGVAFRNIWYAQRHIEIFLKKTIKNIAREFEMPFDEVEEIINQENEIFYMMKNDIFRDKINILNDSYAKELLHYFKVPEIPNVDKVLKEYKRLSRKQKQEFKAKI